MKIRADQLAQKLRQTLAPCYHVAGDEPLLVDEARAAIREAAKARGFTSRELHVATAGFDWSALADAASSLSLFAEQRIVELHLPTGKPGRAGSEAIVNLIERLGPELLLVVSTPKLDRGGQSAKWAKALASAGAVVPIWPIGPRELPGWIDGRMRHAGLQPERDAVRMIAERVEGNLLAAQQEIEKLRLLLGEGKVTAAAVAGAVADSSRYDVFKLADAALAGDQRRALRILAGLRAEGIQPPVIIWSLTRELRTLALLADAVHNGAGLSEAMRAAKVWSTREALLRNAVARHDRRRAYAMLKAAGRADAAAKGQGPGDFWQLAADIVLELAGGGRRAA